MKRDFELQEITLGEYTGFCQQLDIPDYDPQKFPERRVRYFRMMNTLQYPNIGNLLSDLDDGVESLDNVWAFDRARTGAYKRTRKDRERYFQELREKGDYNRLFVDFRKGYHTGPRFTYHDKFFFLKEPNGVWVLRRLGIGKRNFKWYRFRGLPPDLDLSELDRICGVFPRGIQFETEGAG